MEIPSGTAGVSETILEALHRGTSEEMDLTIHQVNGFIGHFDYQNSRDGTTRQFNFAVTVEKTDPVVLTGTTPTSGPSQANFPTSDRV